MKLVCLSDTHGKFPAPKDLPEGDVLLLAGDILSNFHWDREKDAQAQLIELRALDGLLRQTSYRKILMIAGNHDFVFERLPRSVVLEGLQRITYLEGESIEIDGLKFHGHPWQPEFFNWAFNVKRKSDRMRELVARIPADTDVLISHGPPEGILDKPYRVKPCVGCEVLREKVDRMPNLKLMVFGHIHGCYGVFSRDYPRHETIFANVSRCDEGYRPVNAPMVFEVNPCQHRSVAAQAQDFSAAQSTTASQTS